MKSPLIFLTLGFSALGCSALEPDVLSEEELGTCEIVSTDAFDRCVAEANITDDASRAQQDTVARCEAAAREARDECCVDGACESTEELVVDGRSIERVPTPSLPAVPAACNYVNSLKPYKSGSTIWGVSRWCGLVYWARVELQRHRWYGWQVLKSWSGNVTPYVSYEKRLSYGCGGQGTFTYRTVTTTQGSVAYYTTWSPEYRVAC